MSTESPYANGIYCTGSECRRQILPIILFTNSIKPEHRNKTAKYYCTNCAATSTTGKVWKRKCTDCGKTLDKFQNLYPVTEQGAAEKFRCICLDCKNKRNPPPAHPHKPEKSSWLYCWRCGELKNQCRSC